jgi:hypothetical protein
MDGHRAGKPLPSFDCDIRIGGIDLDGAGNRLDGRVHGELDGAVLLLSLCGLRAL